MYSRAFHATCLVAFGTLFSCGSVTVQDAPPLAKATPAQELGTGDHSPASVVFTEIASATEKLNAPRALAFNPLRPDELWVVNYGDESVVIVHDASTDGRTTERRKDGYAQHFMAKPSAIAFGADDTTIGVPGTFATCGESRDTYDDTAPANDFMGPTLWSSDLSIFAMKNPHALGSHLDMLHNSPLCVGIAHQTANVYWTFAGLSSSIVKYDFKKDNGVGNDDHSDGNSYQYATGAVKYAPGIPSHLVFHDADAMLYIADTGNSRIARLDTATGTKGAKLTPMEPMGDDYKMDNAVIDDVVPASSGLLQSPSGLVIQNEHLYVSDNATGRISAFKLDGTRVNYLDTGLGAGALGGMAFGPDGKLYFVDITGNRVVRIDSKPASK